MSYILITTIHCWNVNTRKDIMMSIICKSRCAWKLKQNLVSISNVSRNKKCIPRKFIIKSQGFPHFSGYEWTVRRSVVYQKRKGGNEKNGRKWWTIWNTVGSRESKNGRPHLWELRVGIATHLAISGPRRKFHRICHFVIINGTFLLF